MGVNFDLASFVGLKTGLFELKATGEGVSSDRDEEDISIENENFSGLFVLDVNLDSLLFVVNTVCDTVVTQELNALFLEDLLVFLGYFGIQEWADHRSMLNNSNFCAETGIHRAHLESDDSTSEDDHLFWDRGKFQRSC